MKNELITVYKIEIKAGKFKETPVKRATMDAINRWADKNKLSFVHSKTHPEGGYFKDKKGQCYTFAKQL